MEILGGSICFGISPRLPLEFDDDGTHILCQTLPEVIRQNLKNLFLTNPGERIMDPAFGIGMKRFLFEPNVVAIHGHIKTIAMQQIKKYMPFVTISDIAITQDNEDGNILYVTVSYLISPLNQTDTLNLKVRP